MWFPERSIIGGLHRLRSEHAFVEVNYLFTFQFELLDLVLDLKAPVLIFSFLERIDELDLLDPLGLDFMNLVHLPQ